MNNMEKIVFDYFSADDWDQVRVNIYKYTDCGATLEKVNDTTINIGSIVEGSDVEIGPYTLEYPFTKTDLDAVISTVEDEAEYEWNLANGED